MRILMHTPNYVDSVACTIADGLLDLGHQVYNTRGRLNYGEPAPDGTIYDLYLMCDTDDKEALKYVSRAGHPQIIVHAHDRWTDYLYAPMSNTKPVPDQYCDIMFVRDLDHEVHSRKWYPTFPLDYGIERRYIEAAMAKPLYDFVNRPYDIVFYGTLSTARRIHYLEKLRYADSNYKIDYGANVFNNPDGVWSQWVYGRYTHDPAYYERLAQSKMVFCPVGAGASCFRHMEAYAAGSIPLIQKYPSDIIPLHNFVDGENCILWEDEKDLLDKVDDILSDPQKQMDLHNRCWEFGQEYLLTRCVAQYMLDKINEVENARDKSSNGRI